ncbi:TIR domain-containing protein [Variovorax sp. GB1P17]|uniref:toll/interleukin-1 receptor domain-containing protein n=1 Tax=Variovorax sp. GB1P17 TaxID=3443740 RepID=UPI003F48C772
MAIVSPAPTVFISYSWDDEKHMEWVKNLSEQLRINGVDVRLDRWNVVPGQSLTQFMEAEVQRCDFVLVICTRAYARKSLERSGGVGYEQQIISGNLVGGVSRERFIPVVRDGEFEPGPNCAIPMQFLGIYAIDMRADEKREKSMEALLRAVYKQPALVPPPLGSRPHWAIGFTEDITSEEEMIRLPSMELDGWQLESGVVRHQSNPDTFEIPDEALRRNLKPGNIVKLMFDIEVLDGDLKEISIERMWVIVQERSGPYYIGLLDNDPISCDEDVLSAGDRVVFLPEHVISIIDEKGEEVQVAKSTAPENSA